MLPKTKISFSFGKFNSSNNCRNFSREINFLKLSITNASKIGWINKIRLGMKQFPFFLQIAEVNFFVRFRVSMN